LQNLPLSQTNYLILFIFLFSLITGTSFALFIPNVIVTPTNSEIDSTFFIESPIDVIFMPAPTILDTLVSGMTSDIESSSFIQSPIDRIFVSTPPVLTTLLSPTTSVIDFSSFVSTTSSFFKSPTTSSVSPTIFTATGNSFMFSMAPPIISSTVNPTIFSGTGTEIEISPAPQKTTSMVTPSVFTSSGTILISEPIDNTPPVIIAPDIVIDTVDPLGIEVIFSGLSVTDDVEVESLICNPASGSIFPIGVTVVTCTARDSSFNTSEESFSVTVNLVEEPPPDELIGGELIPIQTTSLLLAGAQTFSWMIPLVLSGIGIGIVLVRRKF